MKHVAAYLLLVLGGNESPSADDVTSALAAVGVEADSDALGRFLGEMEGKSLEELLEAGKGLLAKFGGGGGGGGGGAASGGDEAAAAEEEKPAEEEEVGDAPVVDMFGAGGDGGDY